MAEPDKSQLDRFKEAAREIGTDDDEEWFNEKLRKLVDDKPKQQGDTTLTQLFSRGAH